MNTILQSALGSILRWALAILAGYLVKAGIWTESEAGNYVAAAVVALLALIWSLWQKYKSRVLFLTALMPGPRTENEVKQLIQQKGATPVLSTSPDSVPVPKPTLNPTP